MPQTAVRSYPSREVSQGVGVEWQNPWRLATPFVAGNGDGTLTNPIAALVAADFNLVQNGGRFLRLDRSSGFIRLIPLLLGAGDSITIQFWRFWIGRRGVNTPEIDGELLGPWENALRDFGVGVQTRAYTALADVLRFEVTPLPDSNLIRSVTTGGQTAFLGAPDVFELMGARWGLVSVAARTGTGAVAVVEF